jgi:uncharacterized protein
MLEMRPDCEKCGVDLPADNGGAFICGELLDRPTRVGAALEKFPASTVRKFKP